MLSPWGRGGGGEGGKWKVNIYGQKIYMFCFFCFFVYWFGFLLVGWFVVCFVVAVAFNLVFT